MKCSRILGIDPGSRFTGYGIVDLEGRDLRMVTHGTLMLHNADHADRKLGLKDAVPFELRLFRLYERLSKIIQEYNPTELSIEKVFFAKNAVSALKLGQARGVAIVCAVNHGLKFHEYASTEVKSAIVGHGRADKVQVAKMLERILGAQNFETSDSSDGLALAVCHAQLSRSTVGSKLEKAMNESRVARKSAIGARSKVDEHSEKLIRTASGPRVKKSTRLAESLGIRMEDIVGKKRIRL